MLLTLATFAFAAEMREDHPSTYTVRKGDTLWDISARFLKKPWLWPEIWQANPQVKNPHLIYPGDVLSLVYIDGRPTMQQSQGPRIEPAVDTVPLSQIEPFLKELTIVNDVKSLPYVVGVEEDRLLSSSGQVVYVRGMADAAPGQMVQLARSVQVYGAGYVEGDNSRAGSSLLDASGSGAREHIHWGHLDSLNEAHGEVLGYEMMRQSTGQVLRTQGEVAVVLLREEGREVRVGDRVLPMDTAAYDLQFYPQPPTSILPGAKVLAVADGLTGAGPNSVVALATGARDGVKNGTVFSIWHHGALRADGVKHRNSLGAKMDSVRMPDDYVGHVMVFRTFDRISYGLIMDGVRQARVNDILKHPDAAE